MRRLEQPSLVHACPLEGWGSKGMKRAAKIIFFMHLVYSGAHGVHGEIRVYACRFGTDMFSLMSEDDLQCIFELQIPQVEAVDAKKRSLANTFATGGKKKVVEALAAIPKLPEPSPADQAEFVASMRSCMSNRTCSHEHALHAPRLSWAASLRCCGTQRSCRWMRVAVSNASATCIKLSVWRPVLLAPHCGYHSWLRCGSCGYSAMGEQWLRQLLAVQGVPAARVQKVMLRQFGIAPSKLHKILLVRVLC